MNTFGKCYVFNRISIYKLTQYNYFIISKKLKWNGDKIEKVKKLQGITLELQVLRRSRKKRALKTYKNSRKLKLIN